MKALSALKDDFKFRLRDVNSSLWFTNWSGAGKLEELVLYVDIHDLEMRVKDVYLDGIGSSINYILIFLRVFVTA